MSPTPTTGDCLYVGAADAKHPADISFRHVLAESAYLAHVIGRENCVSVPFAARESLRPSDGEVSAFARHVLLVVFVGAEEEVRRVHTDLVVAVVTDEQSDWNGPVSKAPRYSVGEFKFAMWSGDLEASSTIGRPSSPLPALASHIFDTTAVSVDLLPESVCLGTDRPAHTETISRGRG